ncbi:MAG: UDP-N-acetylglucosamine 2-epimerase [Candidatus Nanoarchaeia archaeon]|nr:UDP-N-acetylglucosamine 2-epimerase [Candidatus Nanoarchaeia archaeon]
MIAIVIGTKAELIKCMPLMLELQKQKRDYYFIHTGQHPLGEACREFGIKSPDFILSEEPKISTKFWSKVSTNSAFWLLKIISRIRKLISKLKPGYVIYHGDTMSTAAAAIASSRLFNPLRKWKNVHLEAGLRSGNLLEPFPEEISRKICDKLSDILLVASELSEKNLSCYKNKKLIINVGNTIVDSASIIHQKDKKKYKKIEEPYALINIHRHENLNNESRMKKIIEIIQSVKIRAIWPLHDNTKSFLEKYNLMDNIRKIKNFNITSLINYSEFIFLMANCKYLITDGGSIQEESLIFRKPCIILREKTERQEGLSTGLNFLTMDVEQGKRIIGQMEKGIRIKNFKNPYGEAGVSQRILEILK